MAERPCNAEHLVRAVRAPRADQLAVLVFHKTPSINCDPRLTPGAQRLSSSQGLSRIDELIHLPAVNRPVGALLGAGKGPQCDFSRASPPSSGLAGLHFPY